jgi:hypothetical protein
MTNLMTDNDRDVSSAARSVHEPFKRTPVRMACGRTSSGSPPGGEDWEGCDQRKEAEEADWTFSLDEMDR